MSEKETALDVVSAKIREQTELVEADYKITLETRLREDLQFDSLDEVQLVMLLEEHYGIEISDEDSEALSTVGAIVAYLEKRKV